ncbi:MAG: ATP-grasp domain-containing protein [Clostridia bacterium]|nr:ATP-grasp domain-containing protein [Clostridia bacterium]
MKKILILGAGIYQVPLIKTAKRMGLYTIVASIPGNYPGFELADKVYYENTTDYGRILAIARKEKIDGIITTGTDVAVITIGRVCDTLGLSGLSFKAAEIATDKLLMKSCYEKYGVRTAKFRKILFDNENYADELSGLELPLMFKSVDSSGSRGITKVNSPDEFDAARNYVLDNTRSNYFIVEEYIEGEEFGAQAFVHKGEIQFILPHGDYVFKGDTGVPIGHFAPYDLSDEVIEDSKQQLRMAIDAMGLDNCAINADFILKDGKTYVLEIGGRSGATCLAELVSIYYGYDYYEKILRTALGEDVDFSAGDGTPADKCVGTPNASMLLMSDRDGVIVSQTNKNPENPDIVDVQFDFQPGAQVHKFKVGPHRIGHVITKGETLDSAVATLNDALAEIEIKVE